MALNINVATEDSAPTTRQTTPSSHGSNLGAAAGVAYDSYGNSPLFGRLPVRSLNAFDLSTLDILELDPLAAIELLPTLFPDASLAVHNILRLGNPGWSITCYNAKSGKEDKKAGRLCTQMMENANRGVDCDIPGAMGGPDALINSLLFNAYLKGAVCVESVLDETLTILDDIVPVDPHSILFVEREEKRGRYRIYQMQRGSMWGSAGLATGQNKQPVKPVTTMPSQEPGSSVNANLNGQNRVELNPNLITYVPLDETLYGRSMVAPAIQLLIFWTRYYISLQVFLHNVAFGDKDGEIDTNLLLTLLDKNMPAAERRKWERDFWGELIKLTGRFADDYKATVKKSPNTAMIHTDLLKMSSLGTARTAYPVKEVMDVCKREIYSALKMLPILMGANDTTSETHATVQMSIFVSGLNYIQGAVKHAVERSLLTGLRAMGYAKAVNVELAFATVNLDDRGKVANAIKQELENEAFKRDEGWQTQDESSENATGSPAVADGPNGEPADNPLYVRTPVAPPAPGDVEGEQADGQGESGLPVDPKPAKVPAGRRGRGRAAMRSGTEFVYTTNTPPPRPAEEDEPLGREWSGFAGRGAANRAGLRNYGANSGKKR